MLRLEVVPELWEAPKLNPDKAALPPLLVRVPVRSPDKGLLPVPVAPLPVPSIEESVPVPIGLLVTGLEPDGALLG